MFKFPQSCTYWYRDGDLKWSGRWQTATCPTSLDLCNLRTQEDRRPDFADAELSSDYKWPCFVQSGHIRKWKALRPIRQGEPKHSLLVMRTLCHSLRPQQRIAVPGWKVAEKVLDVLSLLGTFSWWMRASKPAVTFLVLVWRTDASMVYTWSDSWVCTFLRSCCIFKKYFRSYNINYNFNNFIISKIKILHHNHVRTLINERFSLNIGKTERKDVGDYD